MSWVAAAIATTAAVTGAVSANQTKQRNKGYIEDSYKTAKQRLELKQKYGRQDAAEGLAARGLTGGGDVTASPIAAAMVNGTMTAQGATPHTLGAQQTADNAVQMGLETQDLEQQHSRAEVDNKAQYTNALISSGINGLQAGASIYGAHEDMNALNASGALKQPITPSPIADAMKPSAVGIDNPSNWFGGVHGLNPLGAPGSSWNTQTASDSGHGVSLNGAGMSNSDFHIG